MKFPNNTGRQSHKVFLSIDLDYWQEPTDKKCGQFFIELLKHCTNRPDIVLYPVVSHEEMLPYVNHSGCNHLINMDWHSDICEDKMINWDVSDGKMDINEGIWVNWVDWRKDGKYTWVLPNRKSCFNNKDGGGLCHLRRNPFRSNVTGWKRIESKTRYKIPWSNVQKIGICMSYDWINTPSIEFVKPYVEKMIENNTNDISFIVEALKQWATKLT